MTLLKKGDVIELKKGHIVYCRDQIDKKYRYSDLIKIGELYHESVPLKDGDIGYDPDFLAKEYAK
jgi:hypothetical protein